MAEGNSIRDEIRSEHRKMKDMNIFQKIHIDNERK